MSKFSVFLCLCLPLFVFAQITLQAPDQASAGATIEVTWSGGENPKDFITIVAKGEPEGRYKKYKYARAGKWKAVVPEVPGDYEVRYLGAGNPYPTLASKPLKVTAVSATVQVAATAAAGSKIKVTWTGPGNAKDFITIVPAGSPEKAYRKYRYTRKGSPLELPVPEEAGDYEVRYLTGALYKTLASAPVKVTSVTAEVSAPASVPAGSKFKVTWTGPDNQGDYVTIVKAEAPDGSYAKYKYTRGGSPLELPAPDEAGSYEVRYLTGGKNYTLATTPVEVTATTATLQFQPKAEAGSVLTVTWSGPKNQGDYVTIVPAGAPKGSYDHYRYARRSPLKIPVPEKAGAYEVRYLTGAKGLTLAAEPLEVEATTASLEAADQVKGGETLEIKWQGPDNRRDFIAITAADTKVNDWANYVYTRRGNPVVLKAPQKPGKYVLRYHTGREYHVLAERPITVGKPEQLPGLLKVVPKQGSAVVEDSGAIEIILDASGSMLQRLDGKRRIEIAREVLVNLVGESIPEGATVALRVFGHREADSCRTDLEAPPAPLNRNALIQQIRKIQAKNKAKTPIGRSLELVAEDLAGIKGERVLILITDGEETCGGDPAAAIEALKAQGIDVRVNIVGFAIGEPELEQSFRYLAELGGGSYFRAGNAGQLGNALNKALKLPFDVLDQNGNLVAGSVAGSEPISLMPGTYTVRSREAKPRTFSVTVQSEKTETLSL